MTKHLLKTKEIGYENFFGKNNAKLEYILLESTVDNENLYGIEITKEDSNGVEKECVKYLSKSRQNVEELIDKISCNDVTPMHLVYILDDLCE